MLCAAALAGYLVQIQVLFDTATGSLLAAMLLGLAVRLEAGTVAPRRARRLPAAAQRVALGAAALAFAPPGLWVKHAILGAADVRHLVPGPGAEKAIAAGIEAFPPLANTNRLHLSQELARVWPGVHARDAALAGTTLRRADREAAVARRVEPANWRIRHGLARLCAVAAATGPDHAERARELLAEVRALAAVRPVLLRALSPPGALMARLLADGRIELGWSRSPGAGYHEVARSTAPEALRTIHYRYDPSPGRLAVPAGPFRYSIKACRYAGECSAWADWP